jgi:CHAT domain-containing protein
MGPRWKASERWRNGRAPKRWVASLWPVVDESTSLLMREFYRIRESSPGMTKLEALRESQLRLLRGQLQITPGVELDRGIVSKAAPAGTASFPLSPNAPYAHPFYWAPSFLMGNWL